MPPQLPPILDETELPAVALRSAVLDGELYPIGEGFRPVDLPLDAAARAGSLRAIAVRRRVLAGRTAAWVWGAVADPGRPYRVLIPDTAAVGHAAPHAEEGVLAREARLRLDDVTLLDGVPVTSPLRNAVDLLCGPQEPWHRAAVDLLLAEAAADVPALLADLRSRRRLTGRREAIARLRCW
ncbi:MAG: hypothetical protein BGO95_01305 [Micrococcales bacterium 73-13]|nr:MAG: hypothetical protein BGO95_01305 [Micrococcales bacterium 73-13]